MSKPRSPLLAQSQSLSDWLSYLEQIHPQTIDLGLARVGEVAERLGVRQLPMPVVLVGGTNGKGTTCAVLESIYRAAGYRVGVYASPHLLRYNERVRLLGEEASDQALCDAMAAVEAVRGETSLTFFEFGTLAALWLFARSGLDLVLLEVGLGGRLDATNLIDAEVSVVTSIALDHCDWLGDTREAIGREKAGICRAGRPLISGEPQPPVTLAEVANATGAHLLQVGQDFQAGDRPDGWYYQGPVRSWKALPYPAIPWQNAVTALAVVEQMSLPVSDLAVVQGLQQVRLAGRLQPWGSQPDVWLDVAHNPHAAAYLASRLRQHPLRGRRLAVVGMLRDKDMASTLAELDGIIDLWFLGSLHGPRAATAQMLADVLPHPARCFDSIAAAWAAANAVATAEDEIVVFGSFHTVADVMTTTAMTRG